MSQIPVLDLSSPEFASRLRGALADYGFFYIQNHGIPEDLQTDLIRIAREFFRRSYDEKMKIEMKNGGRAWRGYFPPGGELTSGRPDRKEGIYFGRELAFDHPAVLAKLPLHGANLWPADFPRLRELTLTYMEKMSELAQAILSGVAVSLGLTPTYFKDRFSSEPTILFRIFNYQKHVWRDHEDEWGVREHTDYGFLTLLKQDESGGLQVKARGGEWIEAPPMDGTFVVNIGDMLEVWTHGIYRATPHRVRNLGAGDRISLPFFFDPGWQTRLEPIEASLLSEGDLAVARANPTARWDSMDLRRLPPSTTYGEFLFSKVSKVFPDLAKP